MSKKLRVLTLTLIGALCISLTACGEEQPLQSSDEIKKDLNKIMPKFKMIGKFCMEKAISDNPPSKTIYAKEESDYVIEEYKKCILNNNDGLPLDEEFSKKTDQLKIVLQNEGLSEDKAKDEIYEFAGDVILTVYGPFYDLIPYDNKNN